MEELLSKINAGPQQHTKEWYDLRRFTVGGSSIGTLMKCNSYNTIKSMFAEKVAGKSRDQAGGTAAKWGNIFEDVVHGFAETLIGAKIVGTNGSHQKGAMSYSPDGIAQLDNGNIVLMEFKAPYSREITDTVPESYRHQVQYGLEMFPEVANGLYIEAKIKHCSGSMMGFNDRIFTSTQTNGDNVDMVIPRFIGFIATYNRGIGGRFNPARDLLADDKKLVESRIYRVYCGMQDKRIYYSPLCATMEEFDKAVADYNLFLDKGCYSNGDVLCYKFVDHRIMEIAREPNIKYAEIAEKFITCVRNGVAIKDGGGDPFEAIENWQQAQADK